MISVDWAVDWCDDLGQPLLGLIRDGGWVYNNRQELLDWLAEHGCTYSGDLLFMPDELTKTAFILRWQ